MTNNRENIFNKVRALLAKTVDNGCTEAEAMLALEMAEKLMEQHEISEEDLKLEDKSAVIEASDMKDPQNIRWKLCYWVGKFTETYAFGNKKRVKFAGLRADVDFAIWLDETLTRFVQSELKRYMWANGYQSFQGAKRNRVINSFCIGCCSRINMKLREMVVNRSFVPNSTALVLAKQALIDEAVKDMDIGKPDNRGRKNKIYGDVYRAGVEAGNNASFGRPIEDNNGPLRLTKQ